MTTINEEAEAAIEKKMSARIRVWRYIMVSSLAFAALIITVPTYMYLRDEEEENFKAAFVHVSNAVGDSLNEQYRIMLGEYKNLADTFTTYAQSSVQDDWPTIALPFFALHTQNFHDQSGLEEVSFYPAVRKDHVESWLGFSGTHHEEIVQDGHMTEHGSLDNLNPVGYKSFISRSQEGTLVPENDNKPFYYPSWHAFPAPTTYNLINWNLASVDAYDDAIDALRALSTEAVLSPVQKDGVVVPLSTPFEDTSSETTEPTSMILHPVHESVASSSQVAGVLAGGISWGALIRDSFPEQAQGIMAVVKNTCDQSFSYYHDGADLSFRGEGDLHDSRYDDMEVVVNLSLNHASPRFESTKGHCLYSVHIYPRKSFEDDYTDQTPLLAASIVAVAFGIIFSIFFIYDVYVQRRIVWLVAKVAHSNSIISSLFPEKIRDRLVNRSETESLLYRKSGTIKSLLDAGAEVEAGESESLTEHFPKVTVLIADIVGFNSWSADREPSQVFSLLETVYGVFDEIAEKHKVYKIETVSDSYIAVCGLPEPSTKHATAMGRFAREIAKRMPVVCQELEVALGPNTSELSLRVGMHSGPVTAGVLRGERARFQLFGNTVNTCSLVAKTGTAGKIHVSKATADLLSEEGNGKWTELCEETVYMEGQKDKMQLFLLK